MPVIDDRGLASCEGFEMVRPVGRRHFTHAMHDVDGTHSLIRDWPPVMSLSIQWAMTSGLREDFDAPHVVGELVARVGRERFEETDRFCVESAGLSALTQMEFGIRRAVELGNVPPDAGLELSPGDLRGNSEIIRRIWAGEERFEDVPQPPALLAFIHERAGRLFRLYEAVLNGACRDRNTADARLNPARWRVPGALEFMRHLHAIGCRNYFVTGAVLYSGGGMLEEVEAVGYELGPGKAVEAMLGSSWDRKMPKDEVMRELFAREGIDPAAALVIGDGRSEIKAGVDLGCIAISRLPDHAARQRELHRSLGTNYILRDYPEPLINTLFQRDPGRAAQSRRERKESGQ